VSNIQVIKDVSKDLSNVSTQLGQHKMGAEEANGKTPNKNLIYEDKNGWVEANYVPPFTTTKLR
jgi:hypothetical protein